MKLKPLHRRSSVTIQPRETRITPDPMRASHRLFDHTPRFLEALPISTAEKLLAKVRYNRLIDIFLGIASYSLQSHLRTTVGTIGQIEIDEVYVGVDRSGRQFVVPVQAKGGNDKLSAVQARQDIVCCAEKFPGLICRAISAQFMEGDLIALFELTLEDGAIKVVDETHYRLVPGDQISHEDLQGYALRKK